MPTAPAIDAAALSPYSIPTKSSTASGSVSRVAFTPGPSPRAGTAFPRYGADMCTIPGNVATGGSIIVMPETPAPQPASPEPAVPASQRLSALEQALSDALGELPRDQVVRCVAALIPLEAVVEAAAPPHGGKVRKVSVSMPEELVSAVRARTGSGGFSRYVADAVDREIRNDLIADLIDELDAEHGPVPPDVRAQARREWPTGDEE